MKDTKYPNITVQLTGTDGNAFAIMAKVKTALRREGHGAEVEAFLREARAGDYDHLLYTCMKWVNVQ